MATGKEGPSDARSRRPPCCGSNVTPLRSHLDSFPRRHLAGLIGPWEVQRQRCFAADNIEHFHDISLKSAGPYGPFCERTRGSGADALYIIPQMDRLTFRAVFPPTRAPRSPTPLARRPSTVLNDLKSKAVGSLASQSTASNPKHPNSMRFRTSANLRRCVHPESALVE